MAESLQRSAGWEDLLALPEGIKAEVLGGELWTYPRPRPAHGRSQAVLSGALTGPFDLGREGPGGWWLVIEPDVALGPRDIVSPDLVGWRREHLPDLPRERPITVIPDWVWEMLSPASARLDRTVKADLYLRAGVPLYWLVDLELRTLEAFEAQGGRWVRLGAWTDGDRPRVPPFDAVELDITSLFPPAPQPTA